MEIKEFINEYTQIRELRQNGIAWKISFENSNEMICVQLGDNSCLSKMAKIKNYNNGSLWEGKEKTIFDKENKELQEAILFCQNIVNTRQFIVANSQNVQADLNYLGFLGDKVKIIFKEPYQTRYSKKPKIEHNLYLFSNCWGKLYYSQRGKTGYEFDEIKDKIDVIYKI